MSLAGIAAFDSTVHVTHVWLNDVMQKLGWQDRQAAYHALRVVLHALRDRLDVNAVAALGAQLPMLIRGFYYEGWHPAGKPLKERKLDEFLAPIRAAFGEPPNLDPRPIARAVLQVLAQHVTVGEIEGVKQLLPREIRSLWTEEVHTLWD
jgi:uncharacterized protein (DUF2267 family)